MTLEDSGSGGNAHIRVPNFVVKSLVLGRTTIQVSTTDV